MFGVVADDDLGAVVAGEGVGCFFAHGFGCGLVRTLGPCESMVAWGSGVGGC